MKTKTKSRSLTRLRRDDPLARPPPRPLLRRLAVPPAQNGGQQRRLGATDAVVGGEVGVPARPPSSSSFSSNSASASAAEKAPFPTTSASASAHRAHRLGRGGLQRVRPRRRLQRHVRKVPLLQRRLPLGDALHLGLHRPTQVGEDTRRGADVGRPPFGVGEPGAGLVPEALEALDADLGLAAPLLEVGLGLRRG